MSHRTSVGSYALLRILQLIPLVLSVIVVNFLLIHLAPGNPIDALVGDFPAPESYVRELEVKYGLDKPLSEQLLRYLGSAVQGDLGYSFAYREPVLSIVFQRLGATLLLTGTALFIASIGGISLGVIAAKRPYSIVDNAVTGLGLIGFSLPVFWLGQLLVIIFALKLGWLPSQGIHSARLLGATGLQATIDTGLHLLLPSLVLSFRQLAQISRITRASMLEVMGKEYIVTAYAKGLRERVVRMRHALRNALLPVVTVIGFDAGFLLAGSALVETVFAWPGIGRLLYDALRMRDYPVILGIFVLTAVTVLIVNLITDILYAYLDPRIKY